MPPAVAIAGIGAAASIGGAVMGADAQRDAARTASDTSLAAARENNALARETYAQNAARLDPYAQGGLRAQSALQGLLLGGPSAPVGTTSTGRLINGGPRTGALGGGLNNPQTMPDMREGLQSRDAWASGALRAMGITTGGNPVSTLQNAIQNMSPAQQRGWASYLQSNPDPDTVYEQRQAEYRQAHPNETAAANAGVNGNPASALSAWDQFRNSTNYQWRFDQGQKALQMSALPGGGFDSGATRKAIVEHGQLFAANELSGYMDRLAQQQSLGLGAASALAGVGTNMVGQISSNNNNAADARGNAALIQGNATANMWGGIAGAVGQAAGALGSSYGGGGAQGNWARGVWG